MYIKKSTLTIINWRFFFSDIDAAKYLEQQQRAQVSADLVDKSVDQEILTLGLLYVQLIIF